MKLNFTDDIEFYSDKANTSVVYAEFVVPGEDDGSIEREYLVRIDSPVFESYLRVYIIPKLKEKTSTSKLLEEIKDYFNLHPCEDEIDPMIRTAGYLQGGLIEYDLCNKEQEYVSVTPDGWKTTNSHSFKFLKSAKNLKQVSPRKTSKSLLELLRPYINVSKKQFILFVTWLVQAFCQGSHHCLILSSSKGCGKSTATKAICRILSPSKDSAVMLSNNADHLLTTLTNSYIVAFDNCSDELFDKNLSNILCSAVTGATYTKREAYSTNQQVSFNLHNVLLINGVSFCPPESDFADRCLMLNLKSLEGKRKTDSQLDEEFTRDLPEILGAIFSTISAAMNIVPTLTPTKLPRMAEAFLSMMAIAVTLGISQEKFEEIYFENLADIDRARADVPIVQAVREFMNSNKVQGRKVSGTMTDIYKKVCANYSGSRSDLPKSAAHFSRQLNAEHSTLYTAGFVVNTDDTYDDGTHVEIIKKQK